MGLNRNDEQVVVILKRDGNCVPSSKLWTT